MPTLVILHKPRQWDNKEHTKREGIAQQRTLRNGRYSTTKNLNRENILTKIIENGTTKSIQTERRFQNQEHKERNGVQNKDFFKHEEREGMTQ